MSTTFDFSNRKREGIRVMTVTSGPSLTVQSHKDETDINKIIARFKRGEAPLQREGAQYGDISSIQQLDSTSALNFARETIQTVRSDLAEHQKQQHQEQQQQLEKQLKEKLMAEILAEQSKIPEASKT